MFLLQHSGMYYGMLLIAIVISKFVHSQVNSKRLFFFSCIPLCTVCINHRMMQGILKNQRLQAIPIRSQRMKFY